MRNWSLILKNLFEKDDICFTPRFVVDTRIFADSMQI